MFCNVKLFKYSNHMYIEMVSFFCLNFIDPLKFPFIKKKNTWVLKQGNAKTVLTWVCF